MLEFLKLVLMLNRLTPASGLTAERIAAIQERRLRRLLAHAKRHSPYYARKLAPFDVQTCQLSDLPTLSKAEMMASFDTVVTDPAITRAGVEAFLSVPSNLGTYYLGRYGVSHTSGSQGQPALIVQDRDALMQTFVVQFVRGTRISNRFFPHLERLWRPARMAVMTQHPGFYPSGAAFGYLPAAAKPFFKVLHLSVFDPVEESVTRLNAFQPEYIVGYTSSLETLAREARAGRLRPGATGTLRQIINVSEPLPDASARLIADAFQVPVTNEYAMGECMCLSSGCLCSTGSHLNADLAMLEVVDKENRPVPAGTRGAKVLMTNLYNFVQPIIRYEVDDLVTLSPKSCPCGNPFPLIEAVSGRDKDRLWIEVGGEVRDLPYYIFLAALHGEHDLAEHQVLQTGPNRYVVRVAAQPDKTLSAERIRALVTQSVESEGLGSALHFDVEIVPEIARGPSGKAVRVRNLAGPPPAGAH